MPDAGHGIGVAEYARACVERVVRGQALPESPGGEPFSSPAACFVSIKKHGDLRGCIGTLEPAEPSLAREIARNARSAAYHDPRFAPVSESELDDLTYSVDVLAEPEPCDIADLDPAVYGVIVESGPRRGVLLPDLAGVDSVSRQVDIARQKAGIAAGETVRLCRFTVTRWREGGPDRSSRG